MNNVLLKPTISEKSIAAAKNGVYTFYVGLKASKGMIASEIESYFGVNVIEVNTLKIFSKVKRSISGNRKSFVTSLKKKALIKLKEGQKIDIFELKEEKKGKSKK